MAVAVYGSVISSLIFEHLDTAGDQMGFLYGSISHNYKDIVNDSQINNCQVETLIHISAHQMIHNTVLLFNRLGEINTDILSSSIGCHFENVVGWFTKRRESDLRPSLRERCIHKHMLNLFKHNNPKHFLFVVFTESTNSSQSTINFDYAFYRLINGKFTWTSVQLNNLGDTLHTKYRTSSEDKGVMNEYLRPFRKDFEDLNGSSLHATKMVKLCQYFQEKLLGMCSDLRQSEAERRSMEDRINFLHSQLNSIQPQPSISTDLINLSDSSLTLPDSHDSLVDINLPPAENRLSDSLLRSLQSHGLLDLAEIATDGRPPRSEALEICPSSSEVSVADRLSQDIEPETSKSQIKTRARLRSRKNRSVHEDEDANNSRGEISADLFNSTPSQPKATWAFIASMDNKLERLDDERNAQNYSDDVHGDNLNTNYTTSYSAKLKGHSNFDAVSKSSDFDIGNSGHFR